jgi:YD repeat-containing protein
MGEYNMKSVTFSKSGNIVTETSTMDDGTIRNSTITLDDKGNPVSIVGGDNEVTVTIDYDENGNPSKITTNGDECSVGWGGFE